MKSLTILVAALVITLVLNGPIQSFADPQLDTLVNIATQARSNLNISISQIPNAPGEIISLYQQGSDETDALTAAASAQNVTSAKQHFLAAMNFFKTTNDKINSLNATETNDEQRIDVMQLQSEITRLEKIAETLQTIAITNHVDFNFTQFDTSLTAAKQDLDAGKINEASQSLDTANQLITDAHHAISEAAQQRTTDRAKDFTEKQIERFDKINDLNATQNVTILNSNVTVSTTGSNQTSVENPGEMVAKLRKLVAEGNVDEALKIIKSLDAYQKEATKNHDNQVESQSQTNANAQNNTETNPVPSTNQSNVTTTGNIKTDSSNHEKSIPSNKDKKIDQPSSIHNDNLNQLGNGNKTGSPVIQQGSFDSGQQNKPHDKDHEKIQVKQNKRKQNHD